ncbi:MAG: hypothetical protein M5U34_35350 [Chloroflexi bacterium]|nr:hypothetical protein [Chloroflexota bacterium]
MTTQTNGGYVVVQRSTLPALAGQTIAVRVSGDLVEPTNNGLYYMYSDHPSASSGQALGSVSAIQKDGSTEVEQARYLPFWRLAHGAGQPADEPRLYRPCTQQPGRRG